MHPIILTLVIAAVAPNAAFVQKADSDLVGQYALAALAEKRATDPRVKALAQAVASDSDSASRFLDRYASVHGITLKAKPTFRTDLQYGNMSSLHGRTFDREFVQDLTTDEAFQSGDFQSPGVADPALDHFARKEYTQMQAFKNRAKQLGG